MMNKMLQLVPSLFALPILMVLILILQSLPPHSTQAAASQTTTVTYTPTTALFPNPERGFYHHLETHSNNYLPLDLNTLRNYRQNENITLILRLFYLDDFVTSDISQTYLAKMQADFDTVRAAGVKTIVRFAYTNQPHFAPGTDWPPIPPYGDATKQRILAHLQQLQPLLQANSDVIAVVQAGFIGIWGEWYYTDHFVQDPGNPGVVTPPDWVNRREVLTTTLAALLTDRMVQVRTPLIKQMVFSRTLPISPPEAYNGSDIARTGHHNDCFLASETDSGTYVFPPENDKIYLEAETKYLPMGGETCAPNPPRSQCPTALAELARFHWSYLNADYHLDVLASWDTGTPPHNCLNEVKQRLGYRFALTESTYANEVRAGGTFTININLQNDGWAAPFNPRPVKLLLRHATSDLIYAATLPNDLRFWLADNNTSYSLNHTICTSTNMPPGDYELLLYLPDPKPPLDWRPEYAIRFANDMVWEAGTGYNKLLHRIKVSEPITISACNDPPMLEPTKVYLPIVLRNL